MGRVGGRCSSVVSHDRQATAITGRIAHTRTSRGTLSAGLIWGGGMRVEVSLTRALVEARSAPDSSGGGGMRVEVSLTRALVEACSARDSSGGGAGEG